MWSDRTIRRHAAITAQHIVTEMGENSAAIDPNILILDEQSDGYISSGENVVPSAPGDDLCHQLTCPSDQETCETESDSGDTFSFPEDSSESEIEDITGGFQNVYHPRSECGFGCRRMRGDGYTK